MSKLRASCKDVLHRHGLGLRHAGRVWGYVQARDREVSFGVRRLLTSGCVPRMSSPAGASLIGCCQSAILMASHHDGSVSSSIRACVLQARAFAAKGMMSIQHREWDAWSRWVCSSGFPSHATGPLDAMEPTGVHSAVEMAAAGRGSDGRFNGRRGKASVGQLLREIAHVQRVGGDGESELLSRLVTLASHGAEYVPLVARLIDRVGRARSRTASDEESHDATAVAAAMSGMLLRAGFARESVGIAAISGVYVSIGALMTAG